MKGSVEQEISQAIDQVGGLTQFGKVFAAVHEDRLKKGFIEWVITPEEFFRGNCQEALLAYKKKQNELNLWFFKEYMGKLEKEAVVSTITALNNNDLDRHTYNAIIEACEDPGNRYHEEEPKD